MHESEVEELRSSQAPVPTTRKSEHRRLLTQAALILSMRKLRSRHSHFDGICQLLAFFDREHLCYGILSAAEDKSLLPLQLGRVITSQIHLERAMSILQTFGIIMFTDGYYILPALVQSIVSTRVTKCQDEEFYKFAVLCVSDAREARLQARKSWHSSLVHHAEHLTGFPVLWQRCSADPEFLDAFMGVVLVFEDFGRFERAREMFERLRGAAIENLGAMQDLSIRVTADLSRLYRRLRDFAAAEEMLIQSLKALQSNPDAPELGIAGTMLELASVFKAQRRLADAEQIVEQGHRKLKECKNQSWPYFKYLTWRAELELGSILMLKCDLKGASTHLRIASSYANDTFEPESYESIASARALGVLYTKEEDYPRAEAALQLALSGYTSHYGRDHEETLDVVRELSEVLIRIANFVKLDDLRRQFGLPSYDRSTEEEDFIPPILPRKT